MDIVEELVVATGTALLEANFSRFVGRFCLPHSVATISGKRTINNSEELRQTFSKVVEHYRLAGVDRMERECIAAKFVNNDTIECIHETRLYRRDTLAQQPFRVRSRILKQDGSWKIRDTEYTISDSLRYVRALTE